MKAVLTVIGKDRVGIIAGVSRILADRNANILDISQTTMQGVFTMMMLVDVAEVNVPYTELAAEVDALGETLGLVIRLQHEDIFNAMHRI